MATNRPTVLSNWTNRWLRCFAILLCCAALAFADETRSYYIELTAAKIPGEVVAIVREARPGGSAHTSATVEALQQYLGTLPPGSSVTWHCPPDPPPGYEKFAAEWPEVQKFCAEKKVDFMFSFSAR
jgi:hypothetical protein